MSANQATDGTFEYEIENRHTPAETSVKVTKAWNDANDQDGIRPASVSVRLMNGETAVGEAVTLSAANDWTHTWTGLAKNADGQAITYTVSE